MAFSSNDRDPPMEVLALGLPRTGTVSMTKALDILGIPTYHGFRLITNPDEGKYWEVATDAKFSHEGRMYTRDEWDKYLFGKFGAVTDIASLFWQELTEIYPEAKVVLVERDIDKWYTSITEALLPKVYNPVADFILKYIESTVGSRAGNASRKMFEGYFGGKGTEEIKGTARGVYKKHYAEIRATIAPERLLDYKLGSGWEPLCSFLGKEIPDVEFPRLNEAAEFDKTIKAATVATFRRAAVSAGKYILVPLMASSLALYWYNR